jgi:hypothetical protein
VLLETRHVKAALSAMVVKSDHKDARGIAQLLRIGLVPPSTLQGACIGSDIVGRAYNPYSPDEAAILSAVATIEC